MKLKQPNLISVYHSCVTKYDAVAVVCTDARTQISTSMNLKRSLPFFFETLNKQQWKKRTTKNDFFKRTRFFTHTLPIHFHGLKRLKRTVVFLSKILWYRNRVNKRSHSPCWTFYCFFFFRYQWANTQKSIVITVLYFLQIHDKFPE